MVDQGNGSFAGSVLADLENTWGCIDEMLGSFGPNDWARKHGPDWVMSDLPYHLSYFDRDIVVNPIERGPNVSLAEQAVFRTFNQLNDWNARMFAQRPAGQTPQQALEQMHASRYAVRRMLGQMTDGDLNRPAFCPLPGCGWLPAQMLVMAIRSHTWNHANELRLRLERSSPVPSPSATHGALQFYSSFFTMLFDKQAGANATFTSVMDFTGPGGGAWTTRIANGALTQVEERAAGADLVMSMTPETFGKQLVGMADPMSLMQSGEIKVEGMENMGTYAQLFPPLTLDRVFEPMGAPAPW